MQSENEMTETINSKIKKFVGHTIPLIRRPSTCHGCCTRVDNMSVYIGENKILSNINLHFHCNSFATIVGPNGAGKTTFLRTLLGDIKHQGGIEFVSFDTQVKTRPTIGYIPQKLSIDSTSPLVVRDLFDIVTAPFKNFDQEKIANMRELLGEVGASKLELRRLATLSGGELQRVYLALALTPLPNLLLLDEPLSAIDAKTADEFYRLITKLKSSYDLSIIMVSHDIYRVAKYADRMILLNKTIIADDLPAVVLKKIEEEREGEMGK